MSDSRYLYRIQLANQTSAPFGVGCFSPGAILLIGEQASDPENAPEQRPFCSSKGCSGWLNRMLEMENIPEERLFWVNALNNDSSKIDLPSLIGKLQPSEVIALGSTAWKLCEEYGVRYHKSYHPQYWKRFRSKERYPVIDLLKSLL